MTESIYNFLDYRKYLQNYFKNSKTGAKTKAAKFLGVHTSLLPQILNGSCDLSLEQAEKFNRFFGHNEDESFYFILLVLKELDLALLRFHKDYKNRLRTPGKKV